LGSWRESQNLLQTVQLRLLDGTQGLSLYGALAGQKANKGVFITTSTFTPQATGFAKSVERIVSVNGVRLAELMVEYGIGVALRPLRVQKLDSSYFEE
jgi:restriction system protein